MKTQWKKEKSGEESKNGEAWKTEEKKSEKKIFLTRKETEQG